MEPLVTKDCVHIFSVPETPSITKSRDLTLGSRSIKVLPHCISSNQFPAILITPLTYLNNYPNIKVIE